MNKDELLIDRKLTKEENDIFLAVGKIQDFLEGVNGGFVYLVDTLTDLQAQYFVNKDEFYLKQLSKVIEHEGEKLPVYLKDNAIKVIKKSRRKIKRKNYIQCKLNLLKKLLLRLIPKKFTRNKRKR